MKENLELSFKSKTPLYASELNQIVEKINGIDIPENVSSFTNDAGYITETDISDLATKGELSTLATKAELSSKADSSVISTLATKAELSEFATKADISGLVDIPENVSAFTNDVGYITETDISDFATKTEISSLVYNILMEIEGGDDILY